MINVELSKANSISLTFMVLKNHYLNILIGLSKNT